MKKFMIRLGSYDVEAKIFEVEVEKETPLCVWIKGRRTNKQSNWENYFDSWGDAKNALMKYQEDRCEHIKRQLHAANSKLGNIRSLREDAVK